MLLVQYIVAKPQIPLNPHIKKKKKKTTQDSYWVSFFKYAKHSSFWVSAKAAAMPMAPK